MTITSIGYDYYLTTDAEGVVHSQWEDPRDVGMILQAESTAGEGGNYVHDATTTAYDMVSSSSSSQGGVYPNNNNNNGLHTIGDDTHLGGVEKGPYAQGQGLDQTRAGETKNGHLPTSTSTGSLASAVNVQQGNFSTYLSSPPRSPTNRTLTNGNILSLFHYFYSSTPTYRNIALL